MSMRDLRKAVREGRFNPDDINADWIKFTSWPWRQYGVNDRESVVAFLESIGTTVEQFKAGPIYTRYHDEPGLEFLKDL